MQPQATRVRARPRSRLKATALAASSDESGRDASVSAASKHAAQWPTQLASEWSSCSSQSINELSQGCDRVASGHDARDGMRARTRARERLNSITNNNNNHNCYATCNEDANVIQDSFKMIDKPSSKLEIHRRVMTKMQLTIALLCMVACLRPCSSQLQMMSPPGELASLVGQAGTSVRLPCLIGRQFFCGEPYFIAWYKLNQAGSSGKAVGWTRIDYVRHQQPEPIMMTQQAPSNNFLMLQDATDQEQAMQMTTRQVTNASSRFVFYRGSNGATCDIGGASGISVKRLAELECAQLEINKLELNDEGQYKCEITFSESLEVDKCPPSSLSRLNVIARPREPELLLNGRPLASARGGAGAGAVGGPAAAAEVSLAGASFKEGAQVRLECQSSGGKPAPRIEWLNVTRSTADGDSWSSFEHVGEHDVQLIRLQRKSSSAASQSQGALISSSSVLVALTRFDLSSQFVCLVVASSQAQEAALETQFGRASHWARLLRNAALTPGGAMLKWLKFDIQVKPVSASLLVRDPLRNLTLAPMSWQPGQHQQQLPAHSTFYSLQLNHLYLLQCVVEGSRPASQVAWFNRTAPLALEPVQLEAADYELPAASQHHRGAKSASASAAASTGHRITSFVRQINQPDGTFRIVASLLLTTNIWDNYEEIFCRVSNEAFQFEELTSQVAPILAANLYVNYAPFAKLEVDTANLESAVAVTANETLVRVDDGAQLTLRCLVGANPLDQASIVQVEWFKDQQKLDLQATTKTLPFAIERANQLHMGPAGSAPGARSQADGSMGQLLASSKLLAISALTLKPLVAASSGAYSCHFKIIAAPGPAMNANQAAPKLNSGRSKQIVQVKVVEAKPRAPTLRIQSSAGPLLVYGPTTSQMRPLIEQAATSTRESSDKPATLVVVAAATAEPAADSSISLRCESPIGTKQINAQVAPPAATMQHLKISWLANGLLLHSSSTADTFNVSLATLFSSRDRLAPSVRLSCAHQVVLAQDRASFHANQIRQLPSSNEIELRLPVGPELEVKRQDLMPALRSFSHLELDSNPAQKLRLACLARCEPLCSLRWFINSDEPLEANTVGSGVSAALANKQQQHDYNQALVLRHSEELTEPGARAPIKTADADAGALNLIKFETMSRPAANNSNWLYESTTGTRFRQQQLFGEPGALMRELDERHAGQSTRWSNVYSSLELTYAQLKTLLTRDNELIVKCGIGNANNQWAFKYNLVEPDEWYPSSNAWESSNTNNKPSLHNLLTRSDAELRRFGELQTRILLDKPPTDVKLTFDSSSGPEVSPFGLSLPESQLIEFADPNKPPPLLKCLVKGSPYPPAKFKWLFTHLNGTGDEFHNEAGELDFRQTIELRQRQHLAQPSSAYGYGVVSSLAGNYTCIASNIHGSKAASLPIQIHGRPLCKISLEAERLMPDNSLSADLRCSVYSVPPVVETVWFRGTRELASNKTETIELTTDRAQAESPLTSVKLTIPILNKEQDFMQADLISADVNYKCMAKNSQGYSELCELNQAQKQLILNVALKTNQAIASQATTKSTASMWPLSGWQLFSSGSTNNNINNHLQGDTNSGSSPMTFAGARVDLILVGICCFLLVYFAFLLLSGFVHRRRKLSVPRDTNWHFSSAERRQFNSTINNTKNRLSTNRQHQKSSISEAFHSTIGGAPNYYGDSNGDSEHDIIQSCSQSSQYEDLLASSQQRQAICSQNYQSQALYFNHELASSAATMNRRQLTNNNKSTRVGTTGTLMTLATTQARLQGDGRLGTDANQLVRLELDHSNSRSSGLQQSAVAYSRDYGTRQTKLANNNTHMLLGSQHTSKLTGSDKQHASRSHAAGEQLVANGRHGPLIDGSQTSRIKLNDTVHQQLYMDQQQHQYRKGDADYATTAHISQVSELANDRDDAHIYDDVIYKKMIS